MPRKLSCKQSSAHAIFAVVVPAAGTGERMGGRRKVFLKLCRKPILYHTIERLSQAAGCAELIPVLHPEDRADRTITARLRKRFGIKKVAVGGATRQESVLAGLEAVSPHLNLVLIHDAVRPLVDSEVVRQVAEAARRFGAAIAAVPASETVKQVEPPGRILGTPPRAGLWLARTPQGFRKDLILRAHYAARDGGFCATDDAQLVERLGCEVRVVQDSYDNLKITTAEDLAIAEAILRWRGHQ